MTQKFLIKMNVQKRKKNYFHNHGNNKKKHKQFNLEPGMKGFLCTCNFSEKECVRDAYKILNEFADEIYGLDSIKVQWNSRLYNNINIYKNINLSNFF